MTNLPKRPPFILVLLALLSLALGVLITPELLIELGPFRISLTSDNPLTSRTARIEIAVLRGLCIFAGVFLLALTIWWRRFVETTLIKSIAEHPGSRHRDSARSPIWNRSLYVTLVAWLAGMAYVGVGGFVLPEAVTAPIGANEGLLEQATAVLFLICSVIFGLAAWYYRGDRQTRLFLAIFAFIFLVALGVDYNIFLMARVREETMKHGTRPGMLRGLAVTGGVITSAGIVLAGTFLVLGVLPLVFLTQIGFVIAFGVLLDTFIVRSVLVPALVLDVGPKVWWPSSLARIPDETGAEPGGDGVVAVDGADGRGARAVRAPEGDPAER